MKSLYCQAQAFKYHDSSSKISQSWNKYHETWNNESEVLCICFPCFQGSHFHDLLNSHEIWKMLEVTFTYNNLSEVLRRSNTHRKISNSVVSCQQWLYESKERAVKTRNILIPVLLNKYQYKNSLAVTWWWEVKWQYERRTWSLARTHHWCQKKKKEQRRGQSY